MSVSISKYFWHLAMWKKVCDQIITHGDAIWLSNMVTYFIYKIVYNYSWHPKDFFKIDLQVLLVLYAKLLPDRDMANHTSMLSHSFHNFSSTFHLL